jgi:lysozyme family protein
MVDLNALSAANAKRWQSAKLTKNFSGIAKALVAAKPRYQAVEKATGVPWWAIAVIHERESSQNWTRSLAQGDPINRVSVHVPAGRGPFDSWEAAAIDALVKCPPYLARKKDWSIGTALASLEAYNGIGYAAKGIPSPYLWAGTNQYQAGKYVADGRFDPTHVDAQPGCAGMLKAMMALDPSIQFAAPKTSTTKKASGSVAAGGAAATAAHQAGLNPMWIVAIGVAVAVTAFLIWRLKK